MMKELGSVVVGRRTEEDLLALGQTRFKIGDYLDVCYAAALAPGSVLIDRHGRWLCTRRKSSGGLALLALATTELNNTRALPFIANSPRSMSWV